MPCANVWEVTHIGTSPWQIFQIANALFFIQLKVSQFLHLGYSPIPASKKDLEFCHFLGSPEGLRSLSCCKILPLLNLFRWCDVGFQNLLVDSGTPSSINQPLINSAQGLTAGKMFCSSNAAAFFPKPTFPGCSQTVTFQLQQSTEPVSKTGQASLDACYHEDEGKVSTSVKVFFSVEQT